MKPGNFKKLFLLQFLIFFILSNAFAVEKIEAVPLINLDELSPTFEEDKDILEKNEELDVNTNNLNNEIQEDENIKKGKVYINIKTLDKITAKTSTIRLAIGDKKSFGSLQIHGLKCQISEDNQLRDTVAYLQIKDLAAKDNNQVFLFNGWTFVSSPTLQSIDHPIYDLWVTSCENI
jgi:hypothetical protein